mmetsp:Transcript_18870/g.26280  ORF Transcript_18870/g.26280 Transcript_18870/m.26280 type:complete len:127 (-) Transcript_18870:359-739(-)
MPLQRSMPLKNLGFSVLKARKSYSCDKSQNFEHASSSWSQHSLSASHSSSSLCDLIPKSSFSPRFDPKLARIQFERCSFANKRTCSTCHSRSLDSGIFMYLDKTFCSEACRDEAIVVDKLRALRST